MTGTPSPSTPVRYVGLEPWLPWPLSAWRWWTEPVAAERLAALRIGLATLLLIDIVTTYLPDLDLYFLDSGPSGSRVFGWYTQAPRWTWSALRGLTDQLNQTLLLMLWCGATLGLIFKALTGTAGPRWITLGTVWVVAALGLVGGILGRAMLGPDPSWTARLLGPWQNDALLLRVAAGLWVLSTALLLIGWQTRVAAVVTWGLSTSFANLNPNIDNAGDVIRGIILFYLMLSPCAAVWSLDHFRAARASKRLTSERPPRLVISPWPLRLLFVQLVFIYFMNGLYKIGGVNWWHGDSLHYVFCDVTLTRYSYAQLPVPLWLTRLATWTVLAWEVGFPLWVSLPWTRKAALWFGVLFHLGIFVSMELGNFAPYALAMYLPLVPWERLRNTFRVAT